MKHTFLAAFIAAAAGCAVLSGTAVTATPTTATVTHLADLGGDGGGPGAPPGDQGDCGPGVHGYCHDPSGSNDPDDPGPSRPGHNS